MSTRNDDKPYFHDLQVLNQTGYSRVLSLSPFWCRCQYTYGVSHTEVIVRQIFILRIHPGGAQRLVLRVLLRGVAELFFGTDCSCLLPVSPSPHLHLKWSERMASAGSRWAFSVAACIWKDPMCSPCRLCSRSSGEGWPRRVLYGEHSLIQGVNLTELMGLMLARCSLLERSCEHWVGLCPSQWASPTEYQVALTAQDQEVELEAFYLLKRRMCSYQGSCMGVPSDSLRNVHESQHLLWMLTNPGVSGTASAMTLLCVTDRCKRGDVKQHMILLTVCVGPSTDGGEGGCAAQSSKAAVRVPLGLSPLKSSLGK